MCFLCYTICTFYYRLRDVIIRSKLERCTSKISICVTDQLINFDGTCFLGNVVEPSKTHLNIGNIKVINLIDTRCRSIRKDGVGINVEMKNFLVAFH